METKSVITKNCQMRERITVQAVLETPFDRLLGAHAPEPTEGIEPATCCLQDLGRAVRRALSRVVLFLITGNLVSIRPPSLAVRLPVNRLNRIRSCRASNLTIKTNNSGGLYLITLAK